MITVKGRYPYESKPLTPSNMLVDTECWKSTARVRLDDEANLDFWLEVSFDRSDLEEMLRKMDESED